MNLFHRRTVCILASVFLTVVFIAVRIPPKPKIAAAVLTVLIAAISRIPRLRGSCGKHLIPIAAVVLLALALPLIAVDLPREQILSRSLPDGNLLEFRVKKEVGDGQYVADRVSCNAQSLPLVSLLVETDEVLHIGDRVRASAVLSPLSDTDTLYYGQHGCHAVATVSKVYFSERPSFSPLALAASVSDAFLDRVRAAGGEVGDLLAALLLGETDCLSDRTALHFRRIGISHILAVSGMHFVTLSLALAALLRRLRLRRPAVILITLPLMLFYTILTGASPSVLRACAMALVMQLSYFFGRKSDTLTSLFFSGATLVLLKPTLVFSLSFLLSFSATLGIVVCFHAVRRARAFSRLSPLLRNYLVTPLLSTLAATVFTLPIILISFGRISLLALPANLLFGVPFQLLLCLAVPVLILGPLPAVTAVAETIASPLLSLVAWLSCRPMAMLDASHPLTVLSSLLLIAILLFLLLVPRISARLAKGLSIGAGAALLLSLIITAPPHADTNDVAIAARADVGDFVILSTGISRAVISCTDDGYGSTALLFDALSHDCVTELSLYVPAHYDSATLSELRSLCKSYLVRRVVLPYPQGDSERVYCERVIAYLKREKIPFSLIASGKAISVGSFTLSLSERTAISGKPPAYAWIATEGGRRIAYLSGGASIGLNAELARALNADTLILGSLGLSERTSVYLPTDEIPNRIIVCSPYYTAEGDLVLSECKEYLRIPRS